MNNNLLLWSENFSDFGASEASVDCFQNFTHANFPSKKRVDSKFIIFEDGVIYQ